MRVLHIGFKNFSRRLFDGEWAKRSLADLRLIVFSYNICLAEGVLGPKAKAKGALP